MKHHIINQYIELIELQLTYHLTEQKNIRKNNKRLERLPIDIAEKSLLDIIKNDPYGLIEKELIPSMMRLSTHAIYPVHFVKDVHTYIYLIDKLKAKDNKVMNKNFAKRATILFDEKKQIYKNNAKVLWNGTYINAEKKNAPESIKQFLENNSFNRNKLSWLKIEIGNIIWLNERSSHINLMFDNNIYEKQLQEIFNSVKTQYKGM